MFSTGIKALHSIVLQLSAAKRKEHRAEIFALQTALGDSTDLFPGDSFHATTTLPQGAHWALRPLLIECQEHGIVESGTYGSVQTQFKFTPKELASRLREGQGSFITTRTPLGLTREQRITRGSAEYRISKT